ncbi:MAG: reverse gyrase [Thermoproteota archaeon]
MKLSGKLEPARGVYLYSCINCGGPSGDERLILGLPCPKCLPKVLPVETIEDVAFALEKTGRLLQGSKLAFYARVEREAREIQQLFEKATGSRLWSAQVAWVKRVLKGRSFAIVAPTGLGKTTFGVLMSLYFAKRGEKSVIVVPTSVLVRMVEERLRILSERAGVPARIVALHGRLSQKVRAEYLARIAEGDFDVLVVTAQYVVRNIEKLLEYRGRWKPGLRFVFVDDVDAVLKSGKSVDAVLKLVGFTEADIERGWKLLKLRRQIVQETQRAQQILAKELEKLRRKARQNKRSRITPEEVRKLRKRIFDEVLEPLYRELEQTERAIDEARKRAAILVVSSATGRPRGSRVRLFQALLGFQAGSSGEAIRNIVDAYTFPEGNSLEDRVVQLVKRLGGGGLVYVPLDKGVEYAEKLAALLRENGVRAEAFTSRNQKALDAFRSGNIDVLVGVAVYYGVAVRGLDLPDRIRYAVFAGVPRLKFSARFEEPHPLSIVRAISILAEHAPREVASEAQSLLGRLRNLLRRLSQAALLQVAEELRQQTCASPAARAFCEALSWLRKALSRKDVWDALRAADDVAIVEEGGRTYILVPDVATYIQASGRTSRLFAGGITRGLSIVVVDDPRLLTGLVRRTKWLVDAEWKRFEELDVTKILAEVNADRERVKAIMEGRIRPEHLELVKTALLIVESPNKARTIASFFGRPSSRTIGPLRVYEVSTGDYVLLIAASGGHVYDLVKPTNPGQIVSPNWLMELVEGSAYGPEWGTARNVHGIVVAGKGLRRYLPIYSPLARCLSCGYQWVLLPSEGRSAEKTDVKCPVCGSPLVKSSLDIVESLRDLASEADVVMIGTDPDTEGEKIGYDLASLIKPAARNVVRIEFHEVTRRALIEAIHNPRSFNERLVEAQIVRRVEDRWIGFTLSPLLWSKFWPVYCEWRLKRKLESVKSKASNPSSMINAIAAYSYLREECSKPNYNLSAGRVQTPVLGWIVERSLGYRYLRVPLLVMSFRKGGDKTPSLAIELRLDELSDEVKSRLDRIRESVQAAMEGYDVLEKLDELERMRRENLKSFAEVLRQIKKGGVTISAKVVEVSEEETEVRPPPPFTTDAMLSEAASRLGLSAPEAMKLAQDLFELGLITYHRTDSTRISDVGIAVAREYLAYKYGEERLDTVFAPRRWGEGGAHEAIRPVRPVDTETLMRLVSEGSVQLARPLTRNHYKLYDLIFRRFIASQMKPARVIKQRAKVIIEVKFNGASKLIEREEERVVEVKDPGWLDVYAAVRVQPKLERGEYKLGAIRVRRWSEVQLLTQAEAVRLMKERGIGRPSTYAKIIDTILKRNYAVSRGRVGSLVATWRGIGVYEFLMKRFKQLVSEETTRELQKVMDAIEEGLADYEKVLDDILRKLHNALLSRSSGLSRDEATRFLPIANDGGS